MKIVGETDAGETTMKEERRDGAGLHLLPSRHHHEMRVESTTETLSVTTNEAMHAVEADRHPQEGDKSHSYCTQQ